MTRLLFFLVFFPHLIFAQFYNIPVIDLNNRHDLTVVVDKEKDVYLGHPSTVLLEDGKTILIVYPKGHGRGEIIYKQSKEVPTIHRVVDANGIKRLIMWSGLYPARLAVSENNGLTWSPLKEVGDWGGIVVMGSVVKVKKPGQYLAMFHDDGRFIKKGGKKTGIFTLYQTNSIDGGLTWSKPKEIYSNGKIHLCEPGIIRSPDGKELAMILRENSRTKNSHIMFSNDEGNSWSNPIELPIELTGDRHTGKYTQEGELFISFRDMAKNSPTQGDWVAWVGSYKDLKNGGLGDYRIRIKDNKHKWDCAYPGVEVLPNGEIVTTTYGHWNEGEQPYILSVRLNLDQIEAN